MEGFIRSFMFNGPFLYHSRDGSMHINGECYPIAEFYHQGLVNGTNPKGPEYWNGIRHYFQAIVESAGLSINLFLSKHLIWDDLSNKEKQNVAHYLYRVGRCRPYPNNWLLMTAIIHATLKRLGMRYDEKRMMRCIEKTDRLYIGDGLYRDGKRGGFDYYNAFVFHPYLLLWCMINPDTPDALFEKFKKRTREFLHHYKHLFTANGSFVPFGRTLVCRSATVGIFPLAEFFGCSDVPQGQARRICSGNLKYFHQKGAFHEEGYINLGYHKRLPSLIEFYTGPQSPLWMGIAWWACLFPPQHSFWNVPEEPLEVEKNDYVHVLPTAGVIISGKKRSGHILFSGPLTHPVIGKKYAQMYYSSHFGMEVRKIDGSYCYDNCLAEKTGTSGYVLRRSCLSLNAAYDRFFALSYPLGYRFPLNIVSTYLLFKDNLVVRIHRIQLQRMATLVEGGPALGFEKAFPACLTGDDWTYAQAEGKTLFLKNLYGWDKIVQPQPWDTDGQGSNLLNVSSVVPCLVKEPREKKSYLLISACAAEPELLTHASLNAAVADVRVSEGLVMITFSDGEQFLTQTGEVQSLDMSVNHQQITGNVVYARIPGDGKGGNVLHERTAPSKKKIRAVDVLSARIYRYLAGLKIKEGL